MKLNVNYVVMVGYGDREATYRFHNYEVAKGCASEESLAGKFANLCDKDYNILATYVDGEVQE